MSDHSPTIDVASASSNDAPIASSISIDAAASDAPKSLASPRRSIILVPSPRSSGSQQPQSLLPISDATGNTESAASNASSGAVATASEQPPSESTSVAEATPNDATTSAPLTTSSDDQPATSTTPTITSSDDQSAAPSTPKSLEKEEFRVFHKTLSSDVSQEEAISLITNVNEKSDLFREFTYSDMSYLAQVLTILKFRPGDVIIESGEESSFVGIILSGSLLVKFDNISKKMNEFNLLGELSFFEGGTRTAAVTAAEDAILGMITFNELELLQEYAPMIRLKLICLFATQGMKKMRAVSNPPPAATTKSEKKSARFEDDGKPDAPTAKPLNTKRATFAPNMMQARDSDSFDSTTGNGTTSQRSRSMKFVKGDGSNSGNLAARGDTNSPIPPHPSSQAAQSTAASRTIEALFRIRMLNEQRTQQEAIERALEKRKNAEHKARTHEFITGAFKKEIDRKKRDLDTKHAHIEELIQENMELKEWKKETLKKLAADQRIILQQQDAHSEVANKLANEVEARRTQEKINEEIYNQLEVLVKNRTEVYQGKIDEKEVEVEQVVGKVKQGEMKYQELERKLVEVKKELEASYVTNKEIHSQIENVRLQTQQIANEQVVLQLRSLHSCQDELQELKRNYILLEEKCSSLHHWKDENIEIQLTKEMQLQRLHRSLTENVERHGALISDLNGYKCIIKYLLASQLIKTVKRRKLLQNIQHDQLRLAKKLCKEVQQHYKQHGLQQCSGANGTNTLLAQKLARRHHQAHQQTLQQQSSSTPSSILPEKNLLANPIGNGMSREYQQDSAYSSLEAAYYEFELDLMDEPSEVIGGGGGNASGDRSSSSAFPFSSASSTQPPFMHTKQDDYFIHISDQLPILHTLADELCAQKVYWNITADSFFKRTIEMKGLMMESEGQHATGKNRHRHHDVAPPVINTSTEHMHLSYPVSTNLNTKAEGQPPSSPSKSSEGLESVYTIPRHYTGASNSLSAAVNTMNQNTHCVGSQQNRKGYFQQETKEDDSAANSTPPSTSSSKSSSETSSLKPITSRTPLDSPLPTRGTPSLVVELRESREKIINYKKKVREYRETNSALSIRVNSYAQRVAELEECFQRSIYASPFVPQPMYNPGMMPIPLPGPISLMNQLSPPVTPLPPVTAPATYQQRVPNTKILPLIGNAPMPPPQASQPAPPDSYRLSPSAPSSRLGKDGQKNVTPHSPSAASTSSQQQQKRDPSFLQTGPPSQPYPYPQQRPASIQGLPNSAAPGVPLLVFPSGPLAPNSRTNVSGR